MWPFEMIIRGRQAGKTTKLIEMAAARGGTIVTWNRRSADRIMGMAERRKLNIKTPVTFDELLTERFNSKNIKELYIDDADVLLQQLCKRKQLAAITMSNNDPNGGFHEQN